MKRLIALILVLSSGAVLAADLASFKQIYESEIQKIEDKYMGIAAQSMSDYEVELQKLEKSLAQKGNLQGVVAVRKEKDRFVVNRTPTIAEDDIVADPAEIGNLQKAYNLYYLKQSEAKKQDISKLAKSYSSRLATLKISLTKAMQIEVALEVQKEIDRVSTMILKPETPSSILPSSNNSTLSVWRSLNSIDPEDADGGKFFKPFYKASKPVNVGGKTYKASDLIYSHAPSKIRFSFPKPVTEFRAILSLVDDRPGNVVFEIVVDSGSIFRSEPITKNKRKDVHLKFKPSSSLILVTDDNGSIFHDHSVWLKPEIR